MDLSPLDFPQMWQRPSYKDLTKMLQSLESGPPIWGHHGVQRAKAATLLRTQESLNPQFKAQVTSYLSTIIKSPLAWIEDDDEREEIWELASKRMSERCGRTAMGDVTRRWPFPGDGSLPYQPFELVVREPALTGDSLGLKTWGSSYVLSQHLPQLAATSLARVFHCTPGQSASMVLELGSGTGLLGIAAAAFWKATVYLSDLPDIAPNLRHNIEMNRELVESRGGRMLAGALTWGGQSDDEVDQALFGTSHQFKLVLAADPLYDDHHPALLASAIGQHLAMDSRARAVVMVPRRDETTSRLLESFKKAMLDLDPPLQLESEEELAGQDDWIEDAESGHVRCWLGIFSRSIPPAILSMT